MTAAPTSSPVLVNGAQTPFDAYNIAGSNYFKLRDLAYALSGTPKRFEVGYDGATKAIALTSGQSYTAVGGEMGSSGAGNKAANPTSSKIYLDGSEISLTAYNIGGYNYFKLRDIGQALNFGVDWDGASQTVAIDTSRGYTPEETPDRERLDAVGFWDPDYDYNQNKRFKVAYMGIGQSFIYEAYGASFAHWAARSNVDYTDYLPAENSDALLTQIVDFADRGYNGILLDADMFLYPRISEICAEINLPWMSVIAQPVQWDEGYASGELLHPYVGFNQRAMGAEVGKKLMEYKNYAWTDATPANTALVCLDFSYVSPLHERVIGAAEYWASQGYPESGTIIADVPANDLSAAGAKILTEQTIAEYPEYKYWLVCAIFDDFAQGAALALAESGLTDNACVATIGGDSLRAQWDAGMQDAWRFAYTVPNGIYLEPIFFALYAFMSGQAAPETIWPSWVNYGDPKYGTTYAQLLPQMHWIERGNYKRFFAWSDVYTGADEYGYDKTGISRTDFPSRAAVPANP
jgi:ABC-type sugar transport system substrate-binding protein